MSSLCFRCSGSDKSTPEDLTRDPGYAGRVEYTGTYRGPFTLRISDLREEDSAEYRFTFKTDNFDWGHSFPGTTLSVTGLQVKVTPAAEGQKTLTCSTTCTLTDNPTYIWYKNGQRVDEPTSQQHSSNMLVVWDSTVDIYSCAVEGHEALHSPVVCFQVKVTPEQFSEYKTLTCITTCVLTGNPTYIWCSGSELLQSDLHQEENLCLEGVNSGHILYLCLQVKVTPAAEGQKTLTCITTCTLTDNPTYIWYKNGQRVDEPTSQQYSSNTLVVLGHSVDSYSCAVEHHEDLHSPAVYAPKNTSVSVSPSGEIVEGSSVTLTCSSDANPPVDKYTWYKKNITSPKASGQSYSITNISSEGRGEYYCEAENKYGRLNSSSVSVDIQYTTALFLWVPVVGVGAALTVGALLLTIYCYMKRRHTGGSDDTADRQSVHPDPNSDMYTSLNMKTRSPEYDTLANVRDLAVTQPSDTC
ncbi:B-cell receptor CD22-like [Oncorhynchus masou masou]|uniref:B-cell receptor CD22-like n=1 Tax=Oncorhynchus masou masou TaxID=90313 RepID=UPI003182F2EC